MASAEMQGHFDEYEFVALQFVPYVREEASATIIRTFTADFVYGLFQTQRYANAVLSTVPMQNHTKAGIDRLTDLRLTRQWRLFERNNPPFIDAVLDEAALRRCIGSSEI